MENLLVEGVDSPLTRFSFPFLFLAGTAKKHGKGKVILLLGGNLLLHKSYFVNIGNGSLSPKYLIGEPVTC